MLHHHRGNLHLGVRRGGVHQGVFQPLIGGSGLALLELFPKVLLQLLQGVKLADVLGKLVILDGNFLLPDGVDCHLKGGVLALQALLVVVLRELHRNFKLLAGVVAHKLVLKAGDKLVGTQHQGVLLSLAAGEGHPIQEAFEVDFGGVAVFGGAVVHIHQTAVAVRHAVQLGLDLLLGDGAVFPHRLQALIFPLRGGW